MNEPVFIPESDELKIFKLKKSGHLRNKFTQTQINCGFDFLKNILYKRYGQSYSVSEFVNDANTIFNEAEFFSQNMIYVMNDKKWAFNTKKTMFQILKNILMTISITDSFINRLSFNSYDNKNFNNILIQKYSKLKDDNPIKIRLLNWISIIKEKSNNRSISTLKSIISFYINKCLPMLNLRLECWDDNYIKKNVRITENDVRTLCINFRSYTWLKLFCEDIIKIPFDIKYQNNDQCQHFAFQSGDKHVISTEELEKIYEYLQDKDIFDKLVFMLLMTTGMRVGGLINIKISHVCKIGNKINVFNYGRTLEKNNKWMEFIITEDTKRLIAEWVINKRKGNSEYLFPSSSTNSGHISTNMVRSRFKKICEGIGLHGPHLHLHSIRHTYAKILLKSGNDISIISKLLNHSNTETTEKFYLKENISEIVERSNIPWLDNKNTEKIIPNFLELKKEEHKKETKDKKDKKINRLIYLSTKISI